MNKIASPQELQAELRKLLAYTQSDKPSREVIARGLQDLASGVAPQIPKTAAVDKVPIFSKFETKIAYGQIEAMVRKQYPFATNVEFNPGVEKSHNGSYVNFTYDDETQPQGKGSGSVIVYLENHGSTVRVVAFVNIDG